VLQHILQVRENHNILEDDIVIAGASQGASLGIIDLVLGDAPLNLTRFIAIISPVDHLSFFVPLLKNGVQKG
jgi:predicted esterase